MENAINIENAKNHKMQYLTCIENSIYYHWQIELLLESFKKYQNESELIVAIPNKSNPVECFGKFHKNLSVYDNTIYFHDICQSCNINSVYIPWIFAKRNILKETFCMVSPDCVFQNTFDYDPADQPEIVLALDPFLTFELARFHLGDFWIPFTDNPDKIKNAWVPVGQAMLFNKIPVDFFEKAIQIAEILAKNQEKHVWDMTSRIAWILAIIFYSEGFKVKNDINVQYITSNESGHFVTYEHGINDLFNKKQFLFLSPHFVSAGDPIETLASLLQTKNSNYVSSIAKSTIASR